MGGLNRRLPCRLKCSLSGPAMKSLGLHACFATDAVSRLARIDSAAACASSAALDAARRRARPYGPLQPASHCSWALHNALHACSRLRRPAACSALRLPKHFRFRRGTALAALVRLKRRFTSCFHEGARFALAWGCAQSSKSLSDAARRPACKPTCLQVLSRCFRSASLIVTGALRTSLSKRRWRYRRIYTGGSRIAGAVLAKSIRFCPAAGAARRVSIPCGRFCYAEPCTVLVLGCVLVT